MILGVTQPLYKALAGRFFRPNFHLLDLPVTPEVALKPFGINPGAMTQLALEDLDALVFTFFVFATGAAG